jgi:hypothetical protein
LHADLAGTDHPIDMNDAVVRAMNGQFLFVHADATNERERVCRPECDVTGGVLVKQGVVEQNPGTRDG